MTASPCCNATSWVAGPLSQLPEHVVALVQSVKQGQEELLQGQQAQAGLAPLQRHTCCRGQLHQLCLSLCG